MGVEVEMYVVDRFGRLLNSASVMDKALKSLPKKVTKDFYPYQLEIRTDPHNTAEAIIEDFSKTLKKCVAVFGSLGLYILPYSWMGGNEMFNGVHFHVTYETPGYDFYSMAINTYPLLLLVAYNTRNSPERLSVPSKRIKESRHMGFPRLSRRTNFNDSPRELDITINKHTNNDRHRMKRVETFEVRMFDTPSDMNSFKSLVKIVFKIFKHTDNRKIICNKTNITANSACPGFVDRLTMSRRELCDLKRPYNHIFEEFYVSVSKKLYGLMRVPFVESRHNKIRKLSDIKSKKINLQDVTGSFGTPFRNQVGKPLHLERFMR